MSETRFPYRVRTGFRIFAFRAEARIMAELRPPTEPAVADPTIYQPLSPLALAAFIVATLFAVIVIIFGITAFWSRKPVIFTPLLVMAVIGLGLTIAARIQLDKSEGTRAGRKLVTLAWWFCVLGGASYASYLQAIDMSIRAQSLQAADDWFESLKSGDFNTSFVMTLDPGRRSGINPRDLGSLEGRFGELDLPAYRSSELVRIIERNKPDVELVPAGVKEWVHEPTGFRVQRNFTLRCPEGVYDVAMQLSGIEGRDLTKRVWQVGILSADRNIPRQRLTTYGRAMQELRVETIGLSNEFTRMLEMKVPAGAYFLTLKPDERKELQNKQLLQLFAGYCATIGVPTDLGFLIGGVASLSVPTPQPPGLASFPKSGFFRTVDRKSPNDEQQESFERLWKASFEQASKGGIMTAGRANPNAVESIPGIDWHDESVRITFGLDLAFASESQYSKGRLVISTDRPELIEALKKWREAGWKNPDEADRSPGRVIEKLPRDWRISAIESDLVRMSFQKPDGPPGGGRPGPGPGAP